MRFIEMSGETLLRVAKNDGPSPDELTDVGLTAKSIVRVNHQGDIELRRRSCWELVGGLLGDFDERVKRETGLDWV